MFVGTYFHIIDDKGRLTLPAKWRGELAGKVVVTRAVDNCLYILTEPKFKELATQFEQEGIANAVARGFQRYFAGEASEVEPDGQGRIIIPPKLRQDVGLDGQVVVVGVISHIEVWNPERHKEAEVKIKSDIENLAEQMDDLMRGRNRMAQ